MPNRRKFALLAALLFAVSAPSAQADKKTVCTITVNSPDEREVFRRYLPADEFDFVELVERGRPDWLASSCRAGVRCDVLMISGHFDGGTEFYSDRLDAREFLPVAELERASCSASCPGLFSQLKDVYLFGCGTLDPEATRSVTAEVTRSLLRSGHSVADAERLAQLLNERHGESNREQMRRIFKDVPTIYGFSGKAPLGRYAGPLLERYLVETGTADVASGRPSTKLLALFAPTSMTVTSGASDIDADASHRADVCRFADDRLTPVQRAEFVHQLLGREMAEVRMHLDRIERYAASLTEAERESPAVSMALDAIARDETARLRYLDFARDADSPAVRARMMDLARNLGWLTPADQRAEFIRMVGERIAANTVGVAEVDLVCSLNKDGALSAELPQLRPTPAQASKVANAAVLACLGSASGHARVLRALTSASDDDVQIAEIYLRHRPIGDATELKVAASGVARMPGSDAQVRALETLSRHSLSDRESLQEMTRAFVQAKSVRVQRAVAGVLLRSDYRAIGDADLARALRQYRLKSPDGEDVIDILIRRLQAS